MRGSMNNRTLANTPTEKANTSSSFYPAVEEENAAEAQPQSGKIIWQVSPTSHPEFQLQGSLCVCVLSQTLVLDSANPWMVACQVLLPMGFSRQEYWSELSLLSPGDLPDPGIEPVSLESPSLAGRFFISSTIWESLQGSLGSIVISFPDPHSTGRWNRP